jgi:hypothetical protein
MRRISILLSLLTALALTATMALATVVAGSHLNRPVHTFSVNLTGEAERPHVGDLDASGRSIIQIRPHVGLVCHNTFWRDVDGTVSGGHIHIGGIEDAGPIVIGLFGAPSHPDETFSGDRDRNKRCVETDPGLLWEIVTDPTNYYVNVHSVPDFGPGAIRGQLD